MFCTFEHKKCSRSTPSEVRAQRFILTPLTVSPTQVQPGTFSMPPAMESDRDASKTLGNVRPGRLSKFSSDKDPQNGQVGTLCYLPVPDDTVALLTLLQAWIATTLRVQCRPANGDSKHEY
eukprot:1158229-Pelagomonas_calceolata.AAC.2